jgi:hypothetical protein
LTTRKPKIQLSFSHFENQIGQQGKFSQKKSFFFFLEISENFRINSAIFFSWKSFRNFDITKLNKIYPACTGLIQWGLRPKVPGQETPEQCSFLLVPWFKEYSQGIVTMNP